MRESRPSTAVDGLPEIAGCEFTGTALRVIDGLSSGEWSGALRRLASIDRGIPWWVGDLLVYGEVRFGDGSYADAGKFLGRPANSLRQAAYVSRQVKPEVRIEGLPWGTHRVVAPMSSDEQRRWLNAAETEGWTADELKRRIRAAAEDNFSTGQNSDLDPAAHWAAAGMPEYDPPEEPYRLVISFDTDEDRADFLTAIGSPTIHNRSGRTSSTWWPERPKDDVKSVEFR